MALDSTKLYDSNNDAEFSNEAMTELEREIDSNSEKTGRLSSVNRGSTNANVGIAYPGIPVSLNGATSVYLVTAVLQSSGGPMVTLVSILSFLNFNGFQSRGEIEIARQVYQSDFVTTANKITYDSANSRFQVVVPNHAYSFNSAFSVVKLI